MRRPTYSRGMSPAVSLPAASAGRLLMVLCLAVSTGCFAYAPSFGGQPQAGTRVSLGISDEGRVALSKMVAPGVLRINGTLVGVEQDAWLLNVYEVKTIDGKTAHWAGERVSVNQDHVVSVAERRFSKGRTVAAVAAGTVAITVAALASRLIGGASAPRSGTGGGGEQQ